MDSGAAVLLDLLRSALDVSGRPAGDAVSTDWENVLRLCWQHRVSALAYHGTSQPGSTVKLPSAVVDTLRDRAKANVLRVLELSAESEALALALAERGIPVVLLKGMHLATAVYPSRGLREMVDVDLLVHEGDVATVLAILADRGYRARKPFSLDVDMKVAHHATAVWRGRCSIETHWALADPSWHIRIPTADVWARARPLALGRAQLLCLCDEDLLVHLCYHAVAGHDFTMGLRPFVDIAVLLTRRGSALDWDLVHVIAGQTDVAHMVSLMLALTQRLFGVDLPPQALATSCPDEILDIAEGMVCRGMAPERLLVNVARAREGRTTIERLKWMASRFVQSPAVVAKHYGVSDRSPWLPLLYLKRAWYLLTRYGAIMARLPKGGDAAWYDATERAIVRNWVAGADK